MNIKPDGIEKMAPNPVDAIISCIQLHDDKKGYYNRGDDALLLASLLNGSRIDRAWTVAAVSLLCVWISIIVMQMKSVLVLAKESASRWLFGLLKSLNVTLFAQTAIASVHGRVAT